MSGNLMSKLSMNLQPRLVSLPWLKGSVRCFSHKSDGLEVPVRYIPKKLRDVDQPGCSSLGDNSPKDVIHTGSSSSNGVVILGHETFSRIKRPPGSTTYYHPSNLLFDDAHDKVGKHDKIAVETNSFRAFQEVVEHKNVPDEVVLELQTFKRDYQGQGCKLNQEKSYYDGEMDIEYLEHLEDEAEEAKLLTHDGVDEGVQQRSQTCRTKRDVEKMAVVLLAKRAFTRVELRKKLIAQNFPVNVVEEVVTDFQNRGLINDRLYAETFSHSRWKSLSWGPRRIKQALVKKGVSEGDVKEAVKLVFEESEECDLSSSTRLSSSSLQQLYMQSSKQWQRSQNAPLETRKARIIRWLQYRGFDWGVVSVILKKLESECPP